MLGFRWTRLCAGLLLGAAAGGHAFPNKALTMIVPFNAGTSTDINARELSQVLSRMLQQPVVVDNRPGAEGAIGGRALIASAADGHTLLFASSSLIVLDPLMKKSMAYDPLREFAPVCTLARFSNVMGVTASRAMHSVKDVIAAAKANPGKLTFAYTAATTRLAGEQFAKAAGIQLTAVPYRSTVGALTDVAGGQVDLVFLDHVSGMSFYQSGKIRPLLVAGPQRLGALPEVPSAREFGLADYQIQGWYGIYAAAKVPANTLEKLRGIVEKSLQDPTTLANLEKRGLQPFTRCGVAMADFQQAELRSMRQVVNDAGIQPE